MKKSIRLTDITILMGSLLVIGLSGLWLTSNGVFAYDFTQDEKLTWHLIRSSGMISYILLLIATVWGLFISSQFVKDWSPGIISMTMHTTISWLALLLGLVHGLLLMFDDYFTYTLSDVFIPFAGPYRPEVVGLGTLAFWLLIIISLSFPLKKRIGHKTWKRLHYLSYVAFGMVSIHGIFAGTDGELPGFRILVAFGIMTVVLLLGIRMGKDQAKKARKQRRK